MVKLDFVTNGQMQMLRCNFSTETGSTAHGFASDRSIPRMGRGGRERSFAGRAHALHPGEPALCHKKKEKKKEKKKYRWVKLRTVAVGGLTHFVTALTNPPLQFRGGGAYMGLD